MSSESHVAFYKALKFWISLLLAALAAALVWRLFAAGRGEAGQAVEVGQAIEVGVGERLGISAEAPDRSRASRTSDSAL